MTAETNTEEPSCLEVHVTLRSPGMLAVEYEDKETNESYYGLLLRHSRADQAPFLTDSQFDRWKTTVEKDARQFESGKSATLGSKPSKQDADVSTVADRTTTVGVRNEQQPTLRRRWGFGNGGRVLCTNCEAPLTNGNGKAAAPARAIKTIPNNAQSTSKNSARKSIRAPPKPLTPSRLPLRFGAIPSSSTPSASTDKIPQRPLLTFSNRMTQSNPVRQRIITVDPRQIYPQRFIIGSPGGNNRLVPLFPQRPRILRPPPLRPNPLQLPPPRLFASAVSSGIRTPVSHPTTTSPPKLVPMRPLAKTAVPKVTIAVTAANRFVIKPGMLRSPIKIPQASTPVRIAPRRPPIFVPPPPPDNSDEKEERSEIDDRINNSSSSSSPRESSSPEPDEIDNPLGLRPGDIVWAKMPREPYWPSQIYSFNPGAEVCVYWLGNGSRNQHGFVKLALLERYEESFRRRYQRKRTGGGYQRAIVEGIVKHQSNGHTSSGYYEKLLSAHATNLLNGDCRKDSAKKKRKVTVEQEEKQQEQPRKSARITNNNDNSSSSILDSSFDNIQDTRLDLDEKEEQFVPASTTTTHCDLMADRELPPPPEFSSIFLQSSEKKVPMLTIDRRKIAAD